MDTESGTTTKYTRDKVKTPLYFILDRFLSLINVTSRNSSAFHANECIFSHNEQQKV